MPTAQEHFDGMDKEALAIKQLGKWATKRVGQADMSGAKLKRLDTGFMVPPVLPKPLSGLKMKLPPLRAGLETKPTWPNQLNAKHRPAGGPAIPSDRQIRI